MKKYLLLCVVIITILCNTLWAKSMDVSGKPFCNISEAILKAKAYFNDDILDSSIKSKEDLKTYYSNFYIQSITYTNSYRSARGNLLNNEYCWIIKYTHSQNGSHSLTLALKKDGTINLINSSK